MRELWMRSHARPSKSGLQVPVICGSATRNYNEEDSVYYTPHNNFISLLRQWRKSTKIALIDEPSSVVLTITIHRRNTTL